MKKTRHAWRYPWMSNEPSSRRNLVRFTLARLHAVSSRNMYSEHGFDALMRPEFGHVCQRLIVVSYCTPGSAHPQAASATWRRSSLASSVSQTCPVVRKRVCHLAPASAACMNSSVTRTLLLEFCPLIVWYASPLKSELKPAAMSACAFFSSRIFQPMKSEISGWSMSRHTILAARRVVPPLFVAPAARSNTSRNDIRPEDVPPPESFSWRPRIALKLDPVPEPYLKRRASDFTRS